MLWSVGWQLGVVLPGHLGAAEGWGFTIVLPKNVCLTALSHAHVLRTCLPVDVMHQALLNSVSSCFIDSSV